MRARFLLATILVVGGPALADDFGSPRPSADVEQAIERTISGVDARKTPRWQVQADRVELQVNGKPSGFLYKGSMFEGYPVTGDASRIAISKLETGLVPVKVADHFRVIDMDTDRTVVTGIDIDSLPLRDSELRTSARVTHPKEIEFIEGEKHQPRGESEDYVSLTPLGATVAVEGVLPVGDLHVELRFMDPLESGGVPVKLVLVQGTEARPKLSETLPLDSKAGNLGRADYQGGLGDLMAHYKRLAKGRPLYVFLTEEPEKNVAYMNSYVPLPKRKDWSYRSFRVEQLDSSKTTIREPLPCVTFPTHITKGRPAELTETMKHEVGHVIHELAGDIHNPGYDETFGSHTHELRTNVRSAFVEGFAEYTAFKFRDSSMEGEPLPIQRILSRTAPEAHKTLLGFYMGEVLKREKIQKAVSKTDRDAVSESLWRAIYEEGQPTPKFADFRARLVRDLTGKGQPPLTEAAIETELKAVEKKYTSAVANLKDEEWTEQESKDLNRAFDEVVTSGTASMMGRGDEAAYQEANRRFDRLVERSPGDLMMSEGFIASMLLELDNQLAKEGVDFYGKVLGALKKDPYKGRSHPRVPVNLKELLAVLDQDPELKGKIFPVVASHSSGILKEEHFQLARRRQDDPLTKAKPGASAAGVTEATTGVREARPEDEEPGFEDLRGR